MNAADRLACAWGHREQGDREVLEMHIPYCESTRKNIVMR